MSGCIFGEVGIFLVCGLVWSIGFMLYVAMVDLLERGLEYHG